MQLDKRMLERRLAMNDEQLGSVIQQIAKESGIPQEELGLNPDSIRSIRLALGMANDADLERLNGIYQQYLQGRRPH